MEAPTGYLSKRAAALRETVQDRDQFLRTCDGGDAGSPNARTIWLFGLEPGWSTQDQRNSTTDNGPTRDELDAYSIEMQLRWPYNRNAFKLLAALNGDSPRTYIDFAKRVRPFERGYAGYFKGNLFPSACNNLNDWQDEHHIETGFDSKVEYQNWMRKTRFPIVRDWLDRCRPKLLICTGLTYLEDFLAMTETPQPPQSHVFAINGRSKRLIVATGGPVPVVVIPHLSGGVHSLNSYAAIEGAAALILSACPDLQA